MFYDLNVPWTNANDPQLVQTLHFLHELGYNVIALNYSVSGKLPAELPNPIPHPTALPNLPPNLRILTRITINLTPDVPPPSNARLAALSETYSLLALRPTDEKTLSQACGSLDCAIISLDLTQRFPFWFRHKMLNEAITQGKKIEICYAQALGDALSGNGGGGGYAGSGSGGQGAGATGQGGHAVGRRNFIANATQLVRATRGRGIVISSEARRAVQCRGPWDVVNLGVVWGLPQERGVEGLGREARGCVVSAELKKESFRGVIGVVYGGEKNGVEDVKKGFVSAKSGKQSTQAGSGTKKGEAAAGTKRKNADGDTAVEPPMSKRQMKRMRKEAKAQAKGTLEGEEGGKIDVTPKT